MQHFFCVCVNLLIFELDIFTNSYLDSRFALCHIRIDKLSAYNMLQWMRRVTMYRIESKFPLSKDCEKAKFHRIRISFLLLFFLVRIASNWWDLTTIFILKTINLVVCNALSHKDIYKIEQFRWIFSLLSLGFSPKHFLGQSVSS